MIVSLMDGITDQAGSKAKNLMLLKKEGFAVPDGYVLTGETFTKVIQESGIEKEFTRVTGELGKENIRTVSERLSRLLKKLVLPDSVMEEIEGCISEDKSYAVRSSSIKEDLENYSFAGQYKSFLTIRGTHRIRESVLECYSSMASEEILSYFADNNISLRDYTMPVIIQEMVPTEKSGVAFSINPVSGNDREIVINAGAGLGEDLVSGRIKAESVFYNWYERKMSYGEGNKVLTEEEVFLIANTVLDIQVFYGYPCDVEFALKGDKLFILQSRPITKILHGAIKGQWTTANFKDGGVASTTCTHFMWSLYEYVWEYSMKAFLLDSRILRKKELTKLSRMDYGRPYWNVSVAKLAMSKVPGYKEREFDEELGVKINYEGNGQETRVTPKSVARTILLATGSLMVLRKQLAMLNSYKKEAMDKYQAYLNLDRSNMTLKEIQDTWSLLIKEDYLKNESTYFRQVYINTIHQTIFKSRLLKLVNKNEYLNLLSGLNNVSHLLPFYMLWDIGRRIVSDGEALRYWKETEAQEILEDYNRNYTKSSKAAFAELADFIELYGYHSNREIDVTCPRFSEDAGTVIKQLKEIILLADESSPRVIREKQAQVFQKQLGVLKERIGSKIKCRKILKAINKMRNMLWWREELRDLSTRFYHIIRIYTLALAERYVELRVLKNKEDIFHLRIEDVFDYINGEKSAEELKRLIIRNRRYFDSFRNFSNDTEVGVRYSAVESRVSKDVRSIRGVGCNNMTVTAVARVVESRAEIDRLQPGDILVTRFTDTGWTSKFAGLSGIVTEYGGVLCHAAIVSREYGIPCIVCADRAVDIIKDGSIITINSGTGEIII